MATEAGDRVPASADARRTAERDLRVALAEHAAVWGRRPWWRRVLAWLGVRA